MATIEKMTVHKALTERKILDDRISKTISEGSYCVANKHSNDKIKGIPLEEYVKIMQGDHDKAVCLIARRKALGRAIMLSNAITKVDVAGDEYTVAEAIEMKNHGIEFAQRLRMAIKQQYDIAKAKAQTENDGLDERAERYVTGLFGNKEGKVNREEIEKSKQTYSEMNRYELVDPLNVLEKIEALDKEIDGFLAEVDAALSVSNSLTEITIEY